MGAEGLQVPLCHRQRPLLVVGVLELPSYSSQHKHALQLRDETGALSCVVTETSESDQGGQTAAFNTAWIGTTRIITRRSKVTGAGALPCVCLSCRLSGVCPSVHHGNGEIPPIRFPLIPTPGPGQVHHTQTLQVQHTGQHTGTHTHSASQPVCVWDSVYLQFCLDHLLILSPSVAMVTTLHHRGEGGQTVARKRRREEGDSFVTIATRPCVSMLIRVEQKEGVAWTNTGEELKEQEVGLTQSFVIRAAVIGPAVRWGRDPKNDPMTDRETERERKEQVRHSCV